jgi:hypothetical protein
MGGGKNRSLAKHQLEINKWTFKKTPSPQAFNWKQGVKQGTKGRITLQISLYYHPLDKNFEVYSLYPST